MENYLKQAIATLEATEGFDQATKDYALNYYRQELIKATLGEQHWNQTGTTGWYVWNPSNRYARDGQPFFPFGQPAPQGWAFVQC